MECLGVACGLWAVQWLTGSYKLCQCLVCQMCGERVAWAACQRQSAQLPGTSLYPIRQFGMSETPILVSSCPLPKLSHPSMKNTARAHLALHSIEPRRRRYTYLETITRERMVQSVPRFVFVCCCCSLTLCAFSLRLPRQNHRLNEHASLCFLNISSESRVRLEICFLGMCEVWGEEQKKRRCLSVCGFIGHDEGWYYGGCCCRCGCEMGKDPICLMLAESNVSICHPPQDWTLVFIKINILCTQPSIFFF